MNSDNHSTALPVTRDEPNDDSGYASQEPSPPPNSSKSLTDRAIAKGKSIMPNYIRKPKQLRPYDKPIPQLTWDRFSDLREQYAESLNNLTRGLPNCTSILMTLQVLGENEDSAEPWVFIQCDKEVFKKITRFFQRSAIKCDFEPPQADDRFPRLRVFVYPHKPRPLAKDADIPPQFDPLADSNSHEIYMEKSGITMGARYGTRIMTRYSHGVRHATMGGLIIAIEQIGAERVFGMTAGHFVFEDSREGSCDDDENISSLFDFEDEYDEDLLSIESFQLDLSIIEASLEGEKDMHVVRNDEIEVDWKINMDEWSRLGKLPMVSHDVLEDGKNLDWGLVTIYHHIFYSQNTSSVDIYQASAECGEGHSIVEVRSARGPLQGSLSRSWSYIMLPPGDILIRTYLLSLSDGENLRAGDSGAWIFDSTTQRVLGHVVTSDVLGYGYVVPIYDTLKDINKRLEQYASGYLLLIPAYINRPIDSRDSEVTSMLEGLGIGVGDDDAGDGENYGPLPPGFGEPDFRYSTMKSTPSPPWPGKSPRLELQTPPVAKKLSDAESSKTLTPPQRVTVPTRVPKIDKEAAELEIVFWRLKDRYEEKEIELLEAGEDTNHNKDLKNLEQARDIATRYHLIRKAELRNDMELAFQLKTGLENLPGYEDYIIPSQSDTTGPHQLSSTHDTKHPTGKKTPEGGIDGGEALI